MAVMVPFPSKVYFEMFEREKEKERTKSDAFSQVNEF